MADTALAKKFKCQTQQILIGQTPKAYGIYGINAPAFSY